MCASLFVGYYSLTKQKANMTPSCADKKAYNTKYAPANCAKKVLLDAVWSLLAGRRTQPNTLKRYG